MGPGQRGQLPGPFLRGARGCRWAGEEAGGPRRARVGSSAVLASRGGPCLEPQVEAEGGSDRRR